MTELERALVALGGELDFPPQPNLVAGVRARLERRRLFAPSRRALAFAVAVLVVAFGVAMAVPDARSAILRFFHIGAVTVERVETLPPAQERPLTAGLGAPLSRREAEARAGFEIRLPDVDGQAPTRYYVRPGLIATLFSWHGKPVLLAEFEGEQVSLTKKLAARETRIEPAQIGQFGLWLTGGPHVLQWDWGNRVHRVGSRTAGSVLLWLDGDRTYRLEGELSKAEMMKLGRDITR
jgi:hypothetical protein